MRFRIGLVLLACVLAAPGADKGDWKSARTAWGDPDLQGIWDFRTITPLERPKQLGNKQVLSAEEAEEFQAETLATRNKDRRVEDGITKQADVASAYNQFWWDYGDTLTEDKRTSLIVSPASGRIPKKTAQGETRYADIRARRARPAHGPEDRGAFERCILGFNAGPPYTPSAYNNNVHILQTPDHVVLLIEMVHDARIVPIDGRPQLSENIRQWRGDGRGHWEGGTLVVESRNFSEKTSFRGTGKNLHLTERFTRVGPDRVLYEYKIDDPEMFTESWSAAIPMKWSDQPMYEYACHEGNYAMESMLAGARAQQAAEASTSSGESK